jgi:hypothetical protein
MLSKNGKTISGIAFSRTEKEGSQEKIVGINPPLRL